ncbi:MAG: ParB/RepB/Spo0J family partition protein [Candidatus Binatia bacterium]
MKLQPIKLSEAYESENNPRGNAFKGPSFDDLVASVKEKGVLTAVVARPRKKGTKLYEIVAGNRRFHAAQVAGLKEIPASIQEFTDEQAREVQIIENLQREDVHPLDESSAYRALMESAGYQIADLAAKVGKSEAYVRQRLFLSNLSAKAQKAFRDGDILPGHALLLARLSPDDQPKALEYALDEWDHPTVKDLEEWIEREFLNPLQVQPWIGNKDAEAVLGPHLKQCATTGESLFGEIKQGQCTDLKCFHERSNKYLEFLQAKHPAALRVSSQYGKPKYPGALSETEYKALPTQKKKHCSFAQEAIIVDGKGLGSVVFVCATKECKTHSPEISSGRFRPTPKEIAARKAAAKKKEAADRRAFQNVLKTAAKMKWPLDSKGVSAFLESAFARVHEDSIREYVKQTGWEVPRVKKPYYEKPQLDYRLAFRINTAKMSDGDRMRAILSLFISSTYSSNKAAIVKQLQ